MSFRGLDPVEVSTQDLEAIVFGATERAEAEVHEGREIDRLRHHEGQTDVVSAR